MSQAGLLLDIGTWNWRVTEIHWAPLALKSCRPDFTAARSQLSFLHPNLPKQSHISALIGGKATAIALLAAVLK